MKETLVKKNHAIKPDFPDYLFVKCRKRTGKSWNKWTFSNVYQIRIS